MDTVGQSVSQDDGGHPFRQTALNTKGNSVRDGLRPTNNPTRRQKRDPAVEERAKLLALRKLKLTDPEAYERRAALLGIIPMPPERAPCGRLRPPPKPTKAVPVPVLNPWDRYRFWTKVRKGDADACWPWIGARSGFGYGRFKVAGKLYSPHRLIYAMECGPIKNAIGHHGSVVMHICDNPACCNPAHLTLGTQQDNVTEEEEIR